MEQATFPRQATAVSRAAGRETVSRARAIAFAILFAVFASVLWGTLMWLDDLLMGVIAACLAILPPLTAMAPIINETR